MTISACCNRYWMAMDGLQEEILRILADMEGTFTDWQRDRLFHGFYANGEPIVPPYTNFTIRIKASKGQETDRVTLLDTGAFYAGIFAKVEGEELVIDSTDGKSGDLKEKYGDDIFGLLKEEKAESMEMTSDAMCRYVKNIVGL